jgi:gamma-glutamyltranspeptidase/glutathione hydrolase
LNSEYAISGGHETTIQLAEEILKAGGNAFDAAIAAHFAMYITEPCMASAGAGGFALCYRPGEACKMLDFFTQTPLDKKLDRDCDFEPLHVNFGNETETFHIGMGSIATPGSVAGMFEMHERYGSMPIKTLLQPVKELAISGVAINKFQSIDIKLLEKVFRRDPSVRDIFFSEGQLIQVGDILKLPSYASFLDLLIDDGRDGFYRGEISAIIDRDSREKGGYIRRSDLENYEAIWRNPMALDYFGNKLMLPNGPSIGGAIMGVLLHYQQVYDYDWLQTILAFKRKRFGITQIEKVFQQIYPQLDYQLNSRHKAHNGTSHFNVVDSKGNAVALTCTIGEGSGYFIPGTNMQLNNMLGEAFLLPEGYHNWQSDTRLNSMMTPVMVLDKNNALKFVCGSGGAGRIPFMIGQVIESVFMRGLNLSDAIMHPRIYVHHRTIHYETAYDGNIESVLPSKEWHEKSLFFGGVHAVHLDDSGIMHAAGDPRRFGVSLKGSL